MRKIVGLVLCFSSLSVSAFAADIAVEINAAQIAARSGSRNIGQTNDIHSRMQRAINCLVGPSGEGFDATIPNPCAASGNGVIPDTADAAKKSKFQEAVEKLKSGLTVTDQTAARKVALDSADMILAEAGN